MMFAFESIFLDFNLPNATTWFYFSLLLAVALFFKFSRLLSVRNWDVLTLFLLVPGLLLLLQTRSHPSAPLNRVAFLWLLSVSGYWLIRCLIDLTLVRRPALSPNLNLAGLAWLGGALFVSLIAIAVREPSEPLKRGSRAPAAIGEVERQINDKAVPRNLKTVDTTLWVDRTLAILCHLAIVVGLVVIGGRHFQDVHAGMAAATFYLLLPYTFLLLPYTALGVGQWHHVWPTALVVWAVAAYRWPMLAGGLLGLAAGSVYFPALLFPLWLSFYRRRGAGRFACACVLIAAVSLAVTAFSQWMAGGLQPNLRSVLDLSDWQAWQPATAEGFWTGVLGAYRIPIFIAYLAFVFTTAFWPMPKNLAHLVALSAALLIGIQLWHADRGGVYVLWYLPLLLLLVFRPNLSERLPPPIQPEKDWLARFGRVLKHGVLRLLKLPQPLSRVG